MSLLHQATLLTCDVIFTAKYLEEFRVSSLGLDKTAAAAKNDQSKLSRIKAFLYFMGHGAAKLQDIH